MIKKNKKAQKFIPHFKKRDILFRLVQRLNAYNQNPNISYGLLESDNRDFTVYVYNKEEKQTILHGFETIVNYFDAQGINVPDEPNGLK